MIVSVYERNGGTYGTDDNDTKAQRISMMISYNEESRHVSDQQVNNQRDYHTKENYYKKTKRKAKRRTRLTS